MSRIVDRGAIVAAYVGIGMAVTMAIGFLLVIPIQPIYVLLSIPGGMVIGYYANARSGRQRGAWRRILPNSLTPLVVQGTLGIGGAVLEIAALSFVGVTGDLSRPEWGSMISIESQQLFNAPHVILAPGLAITLTVLGFNLLGDGPRDALDPRLNR